MKALSYTKITQTAEATIRSHLDAEAKDAAAGNAQGAAYQRASANGAFDLWQALVLDHLDAMGRASYATDFARLYRLVSPEQPTNK